MPPSAYILNSTISPRFFNFSKGFRGCKSFEKYLLPSWCMASTQGQHDQCLTTITRMWLCLFPEDYLPEQNYPEYLKSGRLAVSQLPVNLRTSKLTSINGGPWSLKMLPDSPAQVVERDSILQSVISRNLDITQRKVKKSHEDFDKDLPASFFTDALAQTNDHLRPLTDAWSFRSAIIGARKPTWEAELEDVFRDWFYHQRMPFSFQLLYPLAEFYWAPPVINLPAHWNIGHSKICGRSTLMFCASDNGQLAMLSNVTMGRGVFPLLEKDCEKGWE
ncbi:hypothetical protein BDP27DRAFT_1368792 [Rhodocollybia butyracea]|uniref:Uncharacterized protein n=1 Tax=Rhodocollybia butyracea TaxID=206335 RepID=A0A9P5PBH2_9AGAR|nr:hypothetical protein BDP27DRAFT_1368792 [Rhodocollybia butyracea]